MLAGIEDESGGGTLKTGLKGLVGVTSVPREGRPVCPEESVRFGEERLKGDMADPIGRAGASGVISAMHPVGTLAHLK